MRTVPSVIRMGLEAPRCRNVGWLFSGVHGDDGSFWPVRCTGLESSSAGGRGFRCGVLITLFRVWAFAKTASPEVQRIRQSVSVAVCRANLRRLVQPNRLLMGIALLVQI